MYKNKRYEVRIALGNGKLKIYVRKWKIKKSKRTVILQRIIERFIDFNFVYPSISKHKYG